MLEGTFRTGGQEHFYLETQAALAIPGEAGQITVHSSTQNPSEIQAVVAHCLGLRQNQVVCICTRMGGAFGGKESQAAHPALLAALVAHKTGRPARIVYPRDLDMRVTGKRHPYLSRYRPALPPTGGSRPSCLELYSDGGCAADLSLAVMDRSMLHADNAYFIPQFRRHRDGLPDQSAVEHRDARLRRAAGDRRHRERDRGDRGLPGHRCRSTSAGRNCYGGAGRDTTPYGQVVVEQHAARRDRPAGRDGRLLAPPRRGRAVQRGLADASSRARADAGQVRDLVHAADAQPGQRAREHLSRRHDPGLDRRDRDGAGALHQDPPARRRRVRAAARGGPGDAGLDREEQQHSPTAASASTDLNGTAALLRLRDLEGAARRGGRPPFRLARRRASSLRRHTCASSARACATCRRPGSRLGFRELVRLAYEDRVDLGARGFYATPGVDFNRETGRGNPFLYFTNGAAVSEVLIDRLTGELTVTRVDILMDIGRSLNPAIDRGQVIGGFVQGMGWVTTEELLYSEAGELLSHSPNNYKIPTVECMPRDFGLSSWTNSDNPINLLGSKAVGEPPFVLGLSVGAAAKQALASLSPGGRRL